MPLISDQAAPFRWAVLGTGAVARKFVLDLRILGDRVRVVTVASQAVENAERFARDLGISNVAPDYCLSSYKTKHEGGRFPVGRNVFQL